MNRWGFLSILCLAAAPALAATADDATAHSKAFERAVNARDGGAILALYSPDARVVWPGQGEEAHDRAGIEKLISNFLKNLPKDAKITLKSQTAIPVGGGYIATVGHWDESFTDADGKKQTADIRTTEVIKKERGKTLHVIDHASIGLAMRSVTQFRKDAFHARVARNCATASDRVARVPSCSSARPDLRKRAAGTRIAHSAVPDREVG